MIEYGEKNKLFIPNSNHNGGICTIQTIVCDFQTILPQTLKERIYEETFVVSSRGASRRYVSSSSRNYVVRMQNILLSGMNFITSSRCMCTHPTEQTNETHKKAFTLFHLPSWMSLFVYLPFKNFIQYP